MKKIIIVSLLATFATACSTGSKKSGEKAATHELTKKYIEHMDTVNSTNKKALTQLLCPSDKMTLKGKDWKQLLEYANACVNKKSWTMLETIGFKLTEESSFSPWGSYYLSLVAEQKNHMDRAFWFVDLALKKAPSTALLYYQKARLHWKNKDFELSAENFDRALELDPSLTEAHMFLAQLNFRDQDYKIAEKHFNSVLQKDQSNFDALVGLVKINQIKGDSAKELYYLEKAQLIKPKNEWIIKQMSKYVAKVQPRDPATESKTGHGSGQ